MENMNRLIAYVQELQAYKNTFTKRGEERILGNIIQILINHKYGLNRTSDWKHNKSTLLVLLTLFDIGDEFWDLFKPLNEQMKNNTFTPIKR